jgi:hypothetical protein
MQPLTNSAWNKEELPKELKESIIVRMYKERDKQFVTIMESYRFCQLGTKFCPICCSQG